VGSLGRGPRRSQDGSHAATLQGARAPHRHDDRWLHHIGPSTESFIEAPLLGAWTCSSPDDEGPVELTFLDFDGMQYYVRSEDEKSDPQSHRAVATRLGESSFLSLRVIGPKPEDEWTVLRYTVSSDGRLEFKYVDPQVFEDVLDDSPAIRDRLVERLEDPEALHAVMECARHAPVE
jgi:hypothetical protein